MPLVKTAQNLDGVDISEDRLADLLKSDLSDVNDLRLSSNEDEDMEEILLEPELGSDEIELDSDEPTSIVAIELSDDLPEEMDKIEFDWDLDLVPGADDQTEIEDEPEPDPLDDFLEYVHEKMHNVPKHSGWHVLGIDNAIAHFEEILKEIQDAVRNDKDKKLDIEELEKARDACLKAIDGLKNRRDKIESKKFPDKVKKKLKKKASFDWNLKESDWIYEDGFEKTAQKILGITGGLTVNVPYFLHILARTCINAAVSVGRDIEDVFEKLSDKFKLDEREKYQLRSLIEDMGVPIRSDRGYFTGEEVDQESPDNIEWSQQWPA